MANQWIGRVLSKVEIQQAIGRGGMAEVYLGKHATLNRQVAVKVLHAHLMNNSALMERFTAEAQAVAAMRHPHIVQVFDYGEENGQPYIVMELLPGFSLKEYLADLMSSGGQLPETTIARLIGEIGSALDYAHQRGIIHRDVKPANVMLRRESGSIDTTQPLPYDVQTVLTDFGVARIADSAGQTASGTIIGTPAYMSPEQVQGKAVDHRSDIYALGVILYEMLAGKLPFEGETQASIMVKHMTEAPPPLADAPPALQAVMDRALAKDPDSRYQSAGQLAYGLRSALGMAVSGDTPPPIMPVDAGMETLNLEDTPISRIPTSAASPTVEQPSAATVTQVQAGSGMTPLIIAGAIIGGAVIIAGTLFAIGGLGGRNQATPDPTDQVIFTVEETDVPAAADTGEETALAAAAEAPAEADSSPRGSVTFRDDVLEISLTDLEPAPEGTVYEAWLVGEEILPLSLGQIADGQSSLTFVEPGGTSLLTLYSEMVISAEPAGDSDDILSGEILFRASITPERYAAVRQMYENTRQRDVPFAEMLVAGITFQARVHDDHLGFVVDAINDNNFAGTKTHSEHVINITVGDGSPDFTDWDDNSRSENPGDDVGLLNYFLVLEAVLNSPEIEDASLLEKALELHQIGADAESVAISIVTADELSAPVRELGVTLDGLRVSAETNALLAALEDATLAITVEIFPEG
jgi:serine/threonine-protein kinase